MSGFCRSGHIWHDMGRTVEGFVQLGKQVNEVIKDIDINTDIQGRVTQEHKGNCSYR